MKLTEQEKLSTEIAARIVQLQGYAALLRFIAENKARHEEKLAGRARP